MAVKVGPALEARTMSRRTLKAGGGGGAELGCAASGYPCWGGGSAGSVLGLCPSSRCKLVLTPPLPAAEYHGSRLHLNLSCPANDVRVEHNRGRAPRAPFLRLLSTAGAPLVGCACWIRRDHPCCVRRRAWARAGRTGFFVALRQPQRGAQRVTACATCLPLGQAGCGRLIWYCKALVVDPGSDLRNLVRSVGRPQGWHPRIEPIREQPGSLQRLDDVGVLGITNHQDLHWIDSGHVARSELIVSQITPEITDAARRWRPLLFLVLG